MSAIPLHLAAFDGDDEAVNRFLSGGADANALTNDGETPLLFAALNGHTNVVHTLLKWGADVNRLPAQGDTILRRAIKGGYAEIVRLLLARSADPNAEVPDKVLTPEEKAAVREQTRDIAEKLRQLTVSFGGGDTPLPDLLGRFGEEDTTEDHKTPKYPGEYQCLIYAIRSRSYDTLKALLEAGYSPLPVPGMRSPSLLDLAKSIGTGLDMARLLLEHGADPNGSEQQSITPLQNAVMLGDLPFTRLLIEFGAKTEPREPGTSLLTLAIMRESRDMVEFLLDRNVGLDDDQAEMIARHQNRPDLVEMIHQKRGTVWLSLVKAGDVEGVKAALRGGSDIHVADEKGDSALMIATKNGDVNMARVLLDAGADPNRSQQRFSAFAPLHIAAESGAIELAELLLKQGADVHQETSYGQTPLYWAAEQSHGDMADLLITHGARMSVVEAIRLRRPEVVADFWRRGTPVDYANETGETALHAAVALQDSEMVPFLISRGATIDTTDRSGYTPLLLAAVRPHNLEMVRLLLDSGASPQGTVSQRQTPLYFAVVAHDEPMVRLLLERGAPIEQPVSEQMRSQIAKDASDLYSANTSLGMVSNLWQLLNILMRRQRRVLGSDEADTDANRERTSRLWQVVRTLLEFGADANSADHERNTLLTNLIEFDAPLDLIQYAVEKGATVDATKPRQKAPLMTAIDKGRADLVELLLAAGANPNGITTGVTPIQAAQKKDLPEIVTLLKRYGASDEKRQVPDAGLGDEMRLLINSVTQSAPMTLANMHVPDFSRFADRMNATRDKKIAERRARLEAEIRGS